MKMNKIIIIGLMLLNCFSYSFGQEYCENFNIVSILNFPPSPQTPGGNYFLLLLTVYEDNPSNSTIYTNLFFVNELGDTISTPTGPSSHLPIYTTDTIPYILKLNTTINNQDFPTDFTGKLVILHPSHPACLVTYSNVLTRVDNMNPNSKVVVYPNPFADIIKIKSEAQIERILIINLIGETVEKHFPKFDTYEMNVSNIKSGGYCMIIQFTNGETLRRKILKI